MPGSVVKAYCPGEIRHKSFASGIKGAGAGVEVSAEILGKINRYALTPITADEVYVRRKILAHNGVDRDRERFNEALLDDFAATLPGKSTLYAHDRGKFLPLGLYFDATTEEISLEKFKELTGEDPRLPAGLAGVKVLWAWYYVIKTPEVESVLRNIEGGTYRHWSIGFSAKSLVSVKGPYDETLYWEYQGPGEATEGSLVWLGAQQGATSQKNAKAGLGTDDNENQQRGPDMKILKALLGAALGKSFGEAVTDENLVDEVKSALAAKDAQVTTLQAEAKGLKDMADIGKKHIDALAADYARMKALLGECEEAEEAVKTMKGYASTLPPDFLVSEVKALQNRVNEKFPSQGQLEGDLRRDKSGSGENPLIPKS